QPPPRSCLNWAATFSVHFPPASKSTWDNKPDPWKRSAREIYSAHLRGASVRNRSFQESPPRAKPVLAHRKAEEIIAKSGHRRSRQCQRIVRLPCANLGSRLVSRVGRRPSLPHDCVSALDQA